MGAWDRVTVVCLFLGGLVGWSVYTGALDPAARLPEALRPLAALGAVGWGVSAFMAARTLSAIREGVGHAIRVLVFAIAAAGVTVVVYVLVYQALPQDPAAPWVVAGLVFLALRSRRPVRSRHIPAARRRAAIARSGRRFNPKKDHIDHVFPFSRGGSHTEDNLRVVSRRANLRKGARKPRLWDWF